MMNKPLERVTKTCAALGIKPTERILLVRISTQTMHFFRDGSLVRAYAVSTSRRPPSNLKNSLGTPRGLHVITERIGAGQPPGMVFKSRIPTGRHFDEYALPPDDDSGGGDGDGDGIRSEGNSANNGAATLDRDRCEDDCSEGSGGRNRAGGDDEGNRNGDHDRKGSGGDGSDCDEGNGGGDGDGDNSSGGEGVSGDDRDGGALITSRILWLGGLENGVNRGGEVDTHDRYIYIHGTNREHLIGRPQSSGCVLLRNLDIIGLYEEVRAGDMVMIVD
jgi:hypothetical protein